MVLGAVSIGEGWNFDDLPDLSGIDQDALRRWLENPGGPGAYNGGTGATASDLNNAYSGKYKYYEQPVDDDDDTEKEDPRLEDYRRRLEALERRQQNDARLTIRSILSQFGLESLETKVWELYTGNMVDVSNPATLMFALREEDAYKKRFAANEARRARGLPELMPSTYLELEDTYRNVLARNGLPAGFYDTYEDFEKLIAGDVAPVELDNRLSQAYRVVMDADPIVKQRLKEEYGIADGDLLAYFIDPDRARPMLTSADYRRQAQAALVMGAGQRYAGMRVGREQAEQLASLGVSGAQAAEGFQDIAKLGELRQQFGGEESISETEFIGQQFGADEAARKKLVRRAQARVGEFEGGGSFATTTGATSYARESGAGKAR